MTNTLNFIVKITVFIMVISLLSCANSNKNRIQGLGEYPYDLTAEKKKELLEKRVAEFWHAMIAKDRGKVYELYDPFFRAFVTKESWIGTFSPGIYYSFSIENIEMLGNVAFVDSNVSYSFALPSKIDGRMLKRERTDAKITDRWLFVDGSWYKLFYDSISEGLFAHF